MSFYKPTTEKSAWMIVDPSMPMKATWAVEGNSVVGLSLCGDKYFASVNDRHKLCLSILLASESTWQFTEPDIQLASSQFDGAKKVPMAAIGYPVFCETNSTGARICSSSEESPVDGDRTAAKSSGTVTRFSFGPTLKFRGAPDRIEQGAYFGHRLTGVRRYTMVTDYISELNGGVVTIKLAPFDLNGRRVVPPPLVVKAVTEEVCRRVPLA